MKKILKTNRIVIINLLKGTIINALAFVGLSLICITLNLTNFHAKSVLGFLSDTIGFPLYMCTAFQVAGTLMAVGFILFNEENGIFNNLFKEEEN